MQGKLLRSVSLLMIITIASRFLGFIREFIIAYKFGASSTTDAYFTSITIAITFFGGLILAFNTSIIPIYSGISVNHPDRKLKYLNSLQTLLYLCQIALIILFFVSIKWIVTFFFGETDAIVQNQIISLSSVMIFATLFTAKRSIMDGYLQYHNQVTFTSFCGNVLSNVIIIAFIYYATVERTFLLSFGPVVAACVVAFVLHFRVKKFEYSYRPAFEFRMPEIRETLIFVLPIFLNMCLMDINTFVDRSIASSLGNGIVSALTYGYKLNDIFIATFATTLGAALYPQISKSIADNDFRRTSDVVSNSLIYFSILFIPVSAILFFYSHDITYYLLERGAFTSENTLVTAECLRYYSIGMVFFGYRQILYKTMLSFKLTKQVMYNSIVVVVFNLVLDLALVKVWGYRGVALATSITMSWTTVYMIYHLRKQQVELRAKYFAKLTMKVLVSAVISVGFSYYFYMILIGNISGYFSKIVVLSLVIGLGFLMYLAMLIVLKVKEMKRIFAVLYLKFGRKNL